jgi:hypothetical protein
MSEAFKEKDPFVCVEVDAETPIQNLCKRFDDLFPDRVVRLIVNKKYTPWFYVGKGLWIFKKPKEKIDFKFNVLLFENSEFYLTDTQIDLLNSIDINENELKVAGNVILFGIIYDGLLFTTGNIHVIDQMLFKNSKEFIDEFSKFMEYEIILNLTNDENTGMLIFKTKENFIGDKND